MLYRRIITLTALSAIVLFTPATTLHAQGRRHKTTLYTAENSASGQISGKITDAAGPVAGAHIRLVDGGKVISDVATNVDGTFMFRELLPGKYDLSIYKMGYQKRMISNIPVLETFITHNDLELTKAETGKASRNTDMKEYETLDNKRLEKVN